METTQQNHTNGILTPEEAFRTVVAPRGEGTFASNDVNFKGAIFGRDSLEVAEDVLELHPEIAHATLITLASLQGVKNDEISDEEPGKIHHEFRRDRDLDQSSKKIFDDLTSKWGREYSYKDESWQMVYFGSIDSTPLFIRTLDAYCQRYGSSILDETITRRDGQQASVRKAANAATGWLLDQLDNNPLGMLTYKRANPKGIANQAWKDSEEFYVHLNGEKVNHNAPVASIEVQGLAYDALLAAANLIPEKAAGLKARAKELQQMTLKSMWLPDKSYFALGIDFDESGRPRLIKTATANPATLLETGIFEDLPEHQKQMYISGIARTIFSPDFLTDAGFRSRALSHAGLVPFWDYHGSFVVWGKETHDIAKGLYRYGLDRLAMQGDNRVLNGSSVDGKYREFKFVDGDGRVLHGPQSQEDAPGLIRVPSTNNPESIQAWTVAAVLNIIHSRHEQNSTVDHTWKYLLEREILDSIKQVNDLRDSDEIVSRYPTHAYRLEPISALA